MYPKRYKSYRLLMCACVCVSRIVLLLPLVLSVHSVFRQLEFDSAGSICPPMYLIRTLESENRGTPRTCTYEHICYVRSFMHQVPRKIMTCYELEDAKYAVLDLYNDKQKACAHLFWYVMCTHTRVYMCVIVCVCSVYDPKMPSFTGWKYTIPLTHLLGCTCYTITSEAQETLSLVTAQMSKGVLKYVCV